MTVFARLAASDEPTGVPGDGMVLELGVVLGAAVESRLADAANGATTDSVASDSGAAVGIGYCFSGRNARRAPNVRSGTGNVLEFEADDLAATAFEALGTGVLGTGTEFGTANGEMGTGKVFAVLAVEAEFLAGLSGRAETPALG